MVHGFPSSHWLTLLQGVQAEIGAWAHPEVGPQVSVVQALASSQLSDGPALQLPAWHVSAPLHWLPSLHAVPLATVLRWQRPAVQTSVVQGLLSSHWFALVHAVQPEIGAWAQPEAALQVSVVQAFPSSQLSGVPALQVPAWQVSAPLH